MSKVIVHRHAAKYLKRLPEPAKSRIKAILKELESDPTDQPGVKQMVGNWAGYHRLRVGAFRIVYWYEKGEDTVYVDHIGPRGDVYK